MRKLGCFLDSLWIFNFFFLSLFVRFLKLSLIKLLYLVYIVEAWARWAGEGDGPVGWEGVRV
jgi:hypothetical protein